MNEIAAACFRIGDARGAFRPGMTAAEIDAAESVLGSSFAVDHRDLLLLGTPLEGPDWRDPGSEQTLGALRAPIEGALFDVRSNALWPASWGPRPRDDLEAVEIAATEIAAWPRMVPVWQHRCIRAGAPSGEPVFSIMQTDCIFYGDDLAEWADIEFGTARWAPTRNTWQSVLPWSAFAFGMENGEL